MKKNDPNRPTVIHWILVAITLLLYVHWASAPDNDLPPQPNVSTIPTPSEKPRDR